MTAQVLPAGRPAPLPGFWLCEALVIPEAWRHVRRHPRYLVIWLYLYLYGAVAWHRGHLLRVGFAYLQRVDDLLDGDLPVGGEPLLAVEAAETMVASDTPDGSALVALGRRLKAGLRQVAARSVTPCDPDFLVTDVIAAMKADRRRVRAGLILTENELLAQHERTFRNSVDLLFLVLTGGPAAARLPALVALFGWCSTFRDLAPDLAAGIINIPRGVLQAAGYATLPLPPLPDLLAAPAVKAWVRGEWERAAALVNAASAEITALEASRGRRVAGVFLRSMARYLGRCPIRLDGDRGAGSLDALD